MLIHFYRTIAFAICAASFGVHAELRADPFDREALKTELLEINTPAGEIAGQWYTPQNRINFYPDGSLALLLKKHEMGNLKSINGSWKLLGDARMELVFDLPTGGTRTDVVWAGVMKGSLVTIDEDDGLLFYSRALSGEEVEAIRHTTVVEEGDIVGRWWEQGNDANIVNFYDDGKMAIDLRGPTNDGLSVLRAAWGETPLRQLIVEFVYPDMETREEVIDFDFKNGDLRLETEDGKVTWHKRVPEKGMDVPGIVGRWVETSPGNGDAMYIYGNGTMHIRVNYNKETGRLLALNGVWFVYEPGIMKTDFAMPNGEIVSAVMAYEVEDENHVLFTGEDGETKRFERLELLEARRDAQIAAEVLDQKIQADGLPGSRWQEVGGDESILELFADGTLAMETPVAGEVEVITGTWRDQKDGTMALELMLPNGEASSEVVYFKFGNGELMFKYDDGTIVRHQRL